MLVVVSFQMPMEELTACSKQAGILPNQALNQLNGELLQDLGSELVFRLYNGSSDSGDPFLDARLQYWDPTRSTSIVERHTQTMATEQSFLPSQWLEIRMNNPSNSPHSVTGTLVV